MNTEGKKRPPRTPLSPEEVQELILLKKIRQHKETERFRKTRTYKLFNIFNVICFFIYCELLFCYLGPCYYETHFNTYVMVKYQSTPDQPRNIAKITLKDAYGKSYEFVINSEVDVPPKYSAFEVGRDFLLQKKIKGSIATSDKEFRIASASPIMFLSVFVSIFSFIFFFYNLNQNPHSLRAITCINAITVLAFLMI